MTSNSPSFDTYLMHHGVKGMKWGVRKKPDKPQYSRYGKGIIGDRNYESDYTAQYRDMAKGYQYKSDKIAYKAGNMRSGSRRQARKLRKAEKFSNKAKRYNEYAEKSLAIDKKASKMARTIMPNANSGAKSIVRNIVRQSSESYYQMKATDIGRGRKLANYYLYGPNWKSISRDEYVRESVKKKNKSDRRN